VVRYRVDVEGRTFDIEIRPDGRVWVNRRPVDIGLEEIYGRPGSSLLVNNRSYETHVETEGDGECRVVVAGRPYQAILRAEREPSVRTGPRPPRSRLSEVSVPLPGLLVEVRVTEDQHVQEGDVVAMLESMKMQLELRAPRSGVVRDLSAVAGREVAQGEVLAVIESL
jgi:biotin carboxyl carrier protein